MRTFLLTVGLLCCSISVFAQSNSQTISAAYESNTTNSIYGVARPVRSASMPSLVDGLITKVHVKEGDVVKAGQLLVSMDDRMPKAALAIAQVAANRKAVLEQAKLQMKLAEARLQRMQQAFQAQASSRFELEASQAEVDNAQAVIRTAEEEHAAAVATLKLRQAELDRFSIRAPFDGTIVQIRSKAGTTVDPSISVIDVVDLSQLEAELFLDTDMYGKVTTSSSLIFKASSPVNKNLTGRVMSVSPMIDAASRTFRTVVVFPNKGSVLPAGFSVTLDEAASNLTAK